MEKFKNQYVELNAKGRKVEGREQAVNEINRIERG